MTGVLAVIGFLLLRGVILALIGAWQEYLSCKNRMQCAIREQVPTYDPTEAGPGDTGITAIRTVLAGTGPFYR